MSSDEPPKLTRPPSIDEEKKRFANWASRSPLFHSSTSELEASQHRRSSAPDSPAGFTHHHEHSARLSMIAPPSTPPSILCPGFFKTTPTKSLGLGGPLSFLSLSGSKKGSPTHKGTVISAPFFPTHTSVTDLLAITDANHSPSISTSSVSSPSVSSNQSSSTVSETRSPTSSISTSANGSSSISNSSSSINSGMSNSNYNSTNSSSNGSVGGTINSINSAKLGSSSAGPSFNTSTNATTSVTGSGSLKLSAELALFRKNQYMNRKISNSDVRK